MYLYDWVFFFVEMQKIEKYFVQDFVSASLTFLLTRVVDLCSPLF